MPSLFFLVCSFFFLPVFSSFPQINFEPGSPSNDDRQLHRPLASPVLWAALHSPTTDAVVPPTFWPPQQQLVSWHFSLLARQVAVPIAADHYLPQRAPEYSVPPAPAWFSNSGLPLC